MFELELSEQCLDQPPPTPALYSGENLTNPDTATLRECNTWRYYPVLSPTSYLSQHLLHAGLPRPVEPHQLPGPLPHLQVPQVRQVRHLAVHHGVPGDAVRLPDGDRDEGGQQVGRMCKYEPSQF